MLFGESTSRIINSIFKFLYAFLEGMMRKCLTQLLFMVLLAHLTFPAYSITNGGPDNNAHPYVGLAVFKDINGEPLWRCSGALIAPRLFLTAGHCTETPATSATIWFEEDVDAGIPELFTSI